MSYSGSHGSRLVHAAYTPMTTTPTTHTPTSIPTSNPTTVSKKGSRTLLPQGLTVTTQTAGFCAEVVR